MREFVLHDERPRRILCSRPATAFKDYVGQDASVERLLDLVYQGFSNQYHIVEENIMLAGPPSTGKTTLAKMLADTLKTPAVFTDANQVNGGVNVGGVKVPGGADTVIHLMLDSWARYIYHRPPQPMKAGSFTIYIAPPTLVFIDEIHGLGRKTADALLKATERNDAMLFGKSEVINCKNITWVGATTDWGRLPSAFRTRFTRIDLEPPTFDEVVQIVKLNNPGFGNETCKKIVFYGSLVPREALAFARSVQRYADRMGKKPSECVWECAQREGIDQWGMRKKRLDILQTLRHAPMNLRNLSVAIACEGEEVVRHWMPPLLFAKPPLVKFDRLNYSITDEGLKELVKRGLSA
jgi:Holliday junction resolvasome RuvABC ATP-dependent DNA helicase subunit